MIVAEGAIKKAAVAYAEAIENAEYDLAELEAEVLELTRDKDRLVQKLADTAAAHITGALFANPDNRQDR